MEITLLIIFFLLVVSAKSILWVTVWQTKEYRFDRMMEFVNTISGRSVLFHPVAFAELLLLFIGLIFSMTPFSQEYMVWITAVAVLMYCLEFVHFMRLHIRPRWTKKTIVSVLMTSALSAAIFFMFLGFTQDLIAVISLCTVLLIPFFVTAIMTMWIPFTRWSRKRTMHQAKRLIGQYRPTVIGITGSYGKSTTKEFLRLLLTQRYSVLTTSEHVNTDIGIAQTILHSLRPEHEYFIVEMGAYREGEIGATCEMVCPVIGVLTGINEQHVALFGSLDAIRNAKSELLAALPPSGLAVMNKDDINSVQVAKRTRASIQWFSASDIAHVYATDVAVTPEAIRCVLHIGTESAPLHISVHGAHLLSPLLSAITVAYRLGMSLSQIVEAATHVHPLPGTMSLRRGSHGSTIIDDSYNSNPSGFRAALDYLTCFPQKNKILVTPGMLELGVHSTKLHEEMGRRAAAYCSAIVITKKDSARPLCSGARSGGLQADACVVEPYPVRAIQHIESLIDNDTVILIEGRVQKPIRDYLIGL